MGLFSRKRRDHDGDAASDAPRECQHTTLAPRWASAADMGKADKVVSYRCGSCRAEFSAAEGEALLARPSERDADG